MNVSQTQGLNPSRADFAEMLEASMTARREFEEVVVEGVITAIEKDVAVIDVGLKMEGRVPLKEFAAPGRSSELKVGDTVMSGPQADILPGNALPIKNIPLGTEVHNIELRPGKGGQMVRSAGGFAQIVAKEGDYAQLRMPSGEVRKVPVVCMATVGQVGNLDHENVSVGKAGRKRWMGRRPHVRGVAMNPVDHPHGGGEGKSGQGNPHPVSPWGQPTKGYKTRQNKKTQKFIIARRTK